MKILLTFLVLFFNAMLFAQTVTPDINGSVYSFSTGNLIFKVDASSGAKVSSFQINGLEFLFDKSQSLDYLWGSTLWPAPQSEMGWPPPIELDDGIYSPSVDGNIVTLTSPDDVDDDGNSLQFIKTFRADDSDTSITIKYSLINKGATQINKALWELTRVPVNGLSFWPTGPGSVWGDLADGTTELNNYTWFDIDNESRRGSKVFADGSLGWYAHIDNQNRLFIKKFDNVEQTNFANGESEIEVYIGNDYIELENLSSTKILNASDTLNYQVKWYLRQLPMSVTRNAGNEELINYVNFIVYGTPFPTNISSFETLNHSVFPNPTSRFVEFNFSSNIENARISLYDMMGKEHISRYINNGEVLDLGELRSGIYIYSIILDNKIEQGRIVKK